MHPVMYTLKDMYEQHYSKCTGPLNAFQVMMEAARNKASSRKTPATNEMEQSTTLVEASTAISSDAEMDQTSTSVEGSSSLSSGELMCDLCNRAFEGVDVFAEHYSKCTGPLNAFQVMMEAARNKASSRKTPATNEMEQSTTLVEASTAISSEAEMDQTSTSVEGSSSLSSGELSELPTTSKALKRPGVIVNRPAKTAKYDDVHCRKLSPPAVIYADIEAVLHTYDRVQNDPGTSSTTKAQKHTACAVSFYVAHKYFPEQNEMWTYEGTDCIEKFCKALNTKAEMLYNRYWKTFKEPINNLAIDEECIQEYNRCTACEDTICGDEREKFFNYFTGRYEGPIHTKLCDLCNRAFEGVDVFAEHYSKCTGPLNAFQVMMEAARNKASSSKTPASNEMEQSTTLVKASTAISSEAEMDQTSTSVEGSSSLSSGELSELPTTSKALKRSGVIVNRPAKTAKYDDVHCRMMKKLDISLR
ncbi:hypothetical protein ACLKA6_000181 [Drosophila palustris]